MRKKSATETAGEPETGGYQGLGLRFLTPREISMIDELLVSVGKYGEVLLRVQDGKLRYAESRKSFDAYKYRADAEQRRKK